MQTERKEIHITDSVELGEGDAVIVIRGSGISYMGFCNPDLTGEMPENAIFMLAMSRLWEDPELRELAVNDMRRRLSLVVTAHTFKKETLN